MWCLLLRVPSQQYHHFPYDPWNLRLGTTAPKSSESAEATDQQKGGLMGNFCSQMYCVYLSDPRDPGSPSENGIGTSIPFVSVIIHPNHLTFGEPGSSVGDLLRLLPGNGLNMKLERLNKNGFCSSSYNHGSGSPGARFKDQCNSSPKQVFSTI